MKKFITVCVAVFFSLFIISSVVGCSSSKNTTDEKTVTGQIQMVGNEPFARLAVIGENSFYLLNCSGAVKDTIYSNQGRNAKIYYSGISTNAQNQKILEVEKVELLPSATK